jgi:hypothetical protein
MLYPVTAKPGFGSWKLRTGFPPTRFMFGIETAALGFEHAPPVALIRSPRAGRYRSSW